MDRSAAAAVPLPAGRTELATAWIAYGAATLGLVFGWPALVAVLIAYARRRDAVGTPFASHYAWLIRSFWGALGLALVCAAIVMAGAWPVMREAATLASEARGQFDVDLVLGMDWQALLPQAATMAAGGLGLLAVYVWLAYRLVRGALRLASMAPAPEAA